MATGIGTFEIERTVPMNMYSLSKGRCCLVSIIGLLLSITVLIVAFLGPPTFVVDIASANTSSFAKNGDLNVYSHKLFSPKFSSFNRDLKFTAIPRPRIENAEGLSNVPVNMTIVVVFFDDNNKPLVPRLLNTRRYLNCDADAICNPVDVLRFVRIPANPFALNISCETSASIESFVFEVRMFNTEFTTMELWLRVGLVFIAFVLTCWFMHNMRRFPLDEWNLEQTWTIVCLIGLIFYNDPLFGILLLNIGAETFEWPVMQMVSFAFRSLYSAVLLVFWLSVLHGIRQSSRTFCRFYVIKIGLVLPIWALALASYGWALDTYAFNPETDPHSITAKLLPLSIAAGSVAFVYLLGMLYHFLLSCLEVCRMSYLNVRLSYAIGLCCGLVTITMALFLSTFFVPEWRGMLDDPLLVFYSSPLVALGLPILINAHAVMSAYLYGPAVRRTSRKDRKPLVLASAEDGDESDDEQTVYEKNSKVSRYQDYVPVAQRSEKSAKREFYHK